MQNYIVKYFHFPIQLNQTLGFLCKRPLRGLSVLYIVSWLLAAAIYADTSATDGRNFYTSDGKIQLVVRPSIIPVESGEGPDPVRNGLCRMRIWLKNISGQRVFVATSKELGFKQSENVFMFALDQEQHENSVVRLSPSQLDVVGLEPGEVTFLPEVSFPVKKFIGRNIIIGYYIGKKAGTQYGIWDGELTVDIGAMLGSRSPAK